MIHRAILGSVERFMGTLLEHYAGALPVWLSPVQICIIPVAKTHEDYAAGVSRDLAAGGLRVDVKGSEETLGARIRNAQNEKIPYMLIVGDKEIQARKVAVRSRTSGDLGQTALSEFMEKVNRETKEKTV